MNCVSENFMRELSPALQEMVRKARILTAEDAVLSSPIDFLDEDYEIEDVNALKSIASKLLSKKIMTSNVNVKLINGYDLLNMPHCRKWSHISFGCLALDRCTHGGIITRGITEFFGTSAAGKTQLLLQLSLMVQLPQNMGGLDGGTAYICTEDSFPSKRLFIMSKYIDHKYPNLNINYMAQVHVEHVHQSEQLIKSVSERLPELMSNVRIRLIVVDSVAAIFRTYTDFVDRARDMRQLANRLLDLADKYNCAVICVNQVANIPDAVQIEVPCLGLSWAHLGRTRIRIAKIPKQIMHGDTLLTVRKLEIIYSPENPIDSAEFLITEEGVIDVPST